MKIYFETDLYDECLSHCPNGKDCMVGSLFCEQCKHNLVTKRFEEPAYIFSGGHCRLSHADYVDCMKGEEITIWKLIKRFFYKHIY